MAKLIELCTDYHLRKIIKIYKFKKKVCEDKQIYI